MKQRSLLIPIRASYPSFARPPSRCERYTARRSGGLRGRLSSIIWSVRRSAETAVQPRGRSASKVLRARSARSASVGVVLIRFISGAGVAASLGSLRHQPRFFVQGSVRRLNVWEGHPFNVNESLTCWSSCSGCSMRRCINPGSSERSVREGL
jgi:hypothetical protein